MVLPVPVSLGRTAADRRMSKPRWDREAILSTARQTAKELGYDRLQPEQEEAVLAFVGGQDVFGSLPTGFGKTLCFTALRSTSYEGS